MYGIQYRVQRKRFHELEKMRKLEILDKLKEEREISKEIVNTLKLSQTNGFDARNSLSRSGSMIKKKNTLVSFATTSFCYYRSNKNLLSVSFRIHLVDHFS